MRAIVLLGLSLSVAIHGSESDASNNMSVPILEGFNFHACVWDMKTDSKGNSIFLVASHALWRLNLVTRNRELVAGSGTSGYVEGVGESARFSNCRGLEITQNKAIISDTYNHCLREVDLSSRQTSHLAGTCKLTGFKDGPASQAQFRYQYGILVYKSGILVAERSNDAVRLVQAGMVSTIARGSLLRNPNYLIEMDGQVFVATNSALLKIDPESKLVELLAGHKTNRGYSDGPLLSARFEVSLGFLSAGQGVFLMADYYNSNIRRVDLVNGTVSSICTGVQGNVDGNAEECLLNLPWSVMLLRETVYIGQGDGLIRALPFQTFTGELTSTALKD